MLPCALLVKRSHPPLPLPPRKKWCKAKVQVQEEAEEAEEAEDTKEEEDEEEGEEVVVAHRTVRRPSRP